MGAALLLAISTLTQYGAALLALRLTRITRHTAAWLLMASAIFLMAVRRSVSLYRLATGDGDAVVDPLAEGIALLISVLMFAGIAGIGPLFRAIESSRQALRASEASLRQIIDLVPHMIFVKDAEGRVLLANRAVAEAFGTTVEALTGVLHADLQDPGQELTRMLEDDREVLRDGNPRFIAEEFLVDAAGRRRVLQTLKVPYRDFGGDQPAVLGVSVDITKHRASERSLEQRTAELERSNDELEQFAYVASHDLQAPLRAVVSFLQILDQEKASQLDESGREYLAHAVDGGRRMQELIQALLTYSRVGYGQPAPESVDLGRVLDEVLLDLKLSIDESGARVEREALPSLVCVPGQLRQILANLVSNSLRFRGPDRPVIRVGARRTPEGWVVSVTDNGIGIDPSYHEQIFDVFRRLHPRGEHAGTGIGLAIVKKLVERGGGRVWVESAPGRGASFCFSVPDPADP